MKRFIVVILTVLLAFGFVLPVCADEKADLLIDKADLLSEGEAENIKERLEYISEEYKFDLVIVTVDTVGDTDPEYFAERCYEQGLYGQDDKNSGAILFISLWTRDWYMICFGEGEEMVRDVYAVSAYFTPHLSSGDWYEAFEAYIDEMEGRIDEHYNFPWMKKCVIAVAVGLVIALIVTSVMKSKLKSVRFKSNAREYVKDGSFKLNHSRDLYLYSNVTRVAKPKNNSNGSRGGFSGGGSRGGGKF